ncbi:hypothetical protein WDU94_008135, partial [Cyamophila willieti]
MTESQTVIASLAFHPTDRLLVIASYNEVLFWDWSCPAPFAKSTTINEKEKVRFVGFDPLGHKLLTGVANAPHRVESQWNRTPAPPAPQPPPPPPSDEPFQNDYERRIIVCYRFMVQQYEQLVHRYRLLIRGVRNNNSALGNIPGDLPLGESPASSRRRASPSTPGRSIRRFRSSHPLPPRYTMTQISQLARERERIPARYTAVSGLGRDRVRGHIEVAAYLRERREREHNQQRRLTISQLARFRPASVLRVGAAGGSGERRGTGGGLSRSGTGGQGGSARSSERRGPVPAASQASSSSRGDSSSTLQQFESEITESLARLHRNIRRMRIHMPWEQT